MRNSFSIKTLTGIILLLCVSITSAVGFNASVDDNKVTFGNSITVQLLLSDAKPLENIDISAMARDFTIHNQQQFSSYRNVNGTVQVETGWKIVLTPKQQGEFVIPAIALETDKGRFSTQDIKIRVLSAKSGSKKSDSVGISLVSIVSKSKAYINEPIIYTLKIISYKNIANIVLDDIKSNDAIIEKIGEPKQYNQVHGGVNAHIIEIRYAITALKAGKITILPALLRGELQVPTAQPQRQQRFGIFNDLFLDNLIELKPFSLQSDKVSINIIAPATKNDHWLPVRNLDVTEKWDGMQDAKVGDTITRKIKITAKGAFAKQLPSAHDFMQIDNIKSYANKPTFDDTYSEADNTIVGIREEEYSLVPQQAGHITLPEVRIQWWNLKTNKLETTTLPAKSIKVAPANAARSSNVTIDYSTEHPEELQSTAIQAKPRNTVIYVLIGILSGIILSLCFIIIYIIKRKPAIDNDSEFKKNIKPNKEAAVLTVLDLRNSILKHAIKHWAAPQNITLNRLGDNLANHNYAYDINKYNELCESINATLYAKNNNTALDTLLVLWQEFKKSVYRTKNPLNEPVEQDYSRINPT